MNELVQFLCKGEHPVELRQKTREEVKERVREGYILVRFTDTQGGTEIGLRIDRDHSDLRAIENDNGASEIKVVGRLTLDYTPVICTVRLDLTTLTGEGHLEAAGPTIAG